MIGGNSATCSSENPAVSSSGVIDWMDRANTFYPARHAPEFVNANLIQNVGVVGRLGESAIGGMRDK